MQWPPWMIWCINILHLAWGCVMLFAIDELPANFGGTRWFYEYGGAAVWGPGLIVLSALAIASLYVRRGWIAIGFIAPQQIVLFAGSVYAVRALCNDPGAITLLASCYVIPHTICHAGAAFEHHINRHGK